MDLISALPPPSREQWELVCLLFPLVGVISMIQFLTTWYPMGKTSVDSPFNLPGKLGWFLMEIPGTLTLLYTVFSVKNAQGLTALPWQNWAMVCMFVTHYIYRAILSPLFLNPSMAPIHIFVWVSALLFQVGNGVSIGGWLGGYGPTTSADWATARRPAWLVPLGIAIWAVGLAGNIYHDDVLRAIRRDASRKKPAPKKTPVKKGRATGAAAAAAKKKKEAEGKEEKKVYAIPEGGLFGLVLYAHYFCEWVEWCGFWLVGGMACIPARNFVLNELATMLPRAWNGWFWYVDRFGRERIGDRKAAIPFLI